MHRLWCLLFHRAYWRTRHGIMRECIKCETLTIVDHGSVWGHPAGSTEELRGSIMVLEMKGRS
jgi:hypothetical protein